MDSITSKLISKLDKSPVRPKHLKQKTFFKQRGPHVGLYVKAKNQHVWVCWVNKSEQRILGRMGVKSFT